MKCSCQHKRQDTACAAPQLRDRRTTRLIAAALGHRHADRFSPVQDSPCSSTAPSPPLNVARIILLAARSSGRALRPGPVVSRDPRLAYEHDCAIALRAGSERVRQDIGVAIAWVTADYCHAQSAVRHPGRQSLVNLRPFRGAAASRLAGRTEATQAQVPPEQRVGRYVTGLARQTARVDDEPTVSQAGREAGGGLTCHRINLEADGLAIRDFSDSPGQLVAGEQDRVSAPCPELPKSDSRRTTFPVL